MYDDVINTGFSPGGYIYTFDTNTPPGKVQPYSYRIGADARDLTHVCGNYYLCRCWGKFDDNAVPSLRFEFDSNGRVISVTAALPLDTEYFTMFEQLWRTYGNVVLNQFVDIYFKMQPTRYFVMPDMLRHIENFAKFYAAVPNDRDKFLFAAKHYYVGMVAEENKENCRVGGLLKALGVCDCTIGGLSVASAAKCMDGKSSEFIREYALDKFGLFHRGTRYFNSRHFPRLVQQGYFMGGELELYQSEMVLAKYTKRPASELPWLDTYGYFDVLTLARSGIFVPIK